jgi:hypothetical protein
MSNRFAAGLSKVKQASGRPEPVESDPAVPEAPASADAKPPSRRGKVIIAAYYDEAVRQQFAILAVKQRCTQAALLAEALNLLFEKYGEPPIARA